MLKKRYFPWALLTLIATFLFIWACNENSVSNNDPDEMEELTLEQRMALAESVVKGGFLSGPHYNLNIIGVPKNKTANMTGNNGHRIFVKLEGNSKIYLAEGEDFQVLDANGTDGDGAKFQLPNPDPDSTGTTWYSVFARPLGQPGGNATMVTCGTDTLTGEEYCSTMQAVFVRDKGQSSFKNVSRYLLYIYADTDGDGDADKRYSIFDDELEDYAWKYDNNGLKLLQLRFYEIATTVPGL